MNIPDGLYYSKDHEWIRVEGDIATEGITDYAQSELSDIVYVELPQVGRKVKKGEAIGTIEAVKTVADLYAAVSGEIVEVNENLKTSPQVVNSDPYGEGWMVKIKMENPDELKELMTADQYKKHIGQ
ncbi:glycine cleavage system protein GcvH [bacterium]|nr:MAG: glycine cleavage system protein GcvH [bacterium]RKZ24047.1 MAG: glycine cleavage system protein GcvH [bacterium]